MNIKKRGFATKEFWSATKLVTQEKYLSWEVTCTLQRMLQILSGDEEKG